MCMCMLMAGVVDVRCGASIAGLVRLYVPQSTRSERDSKQSVVGQS